MNNFLLSLFFLLTISSCRTTTVAQQTYRYVSLGDSYTIGTGANPEESYPVLLTKHLKENNIKIDLIANPSVNGRTTQGVINFELPQLDTSKATFVTLLIGVNDWVIGTDAETFQNRLIYIIDHIEAQLPDKNKLVLITVPDFGVTPASGNYSRGRDVSKGLAEFNTIILSEAKKRNLKTVDLFEISKKMVANSGLVAPDGLHPSAKEYAVWEMVIYPVVYDLLVNK